MTDPDTSAIDLETENARLRNWLGMVARDLGHLRVRIGLQDPGSPWPGELAAIERAATALLPPAEGEATP